MSAEDLRWDEETKSYILYLGFTGRAVGLTEPQKKTLRELLNAHDRSMCVALHNDGEGSDQEFAALAKELGFRVRTTRADLSPMPRNRELVSQSAKLFAAPPTDFLLKRGSGSWETIKYAWKASKHVFIALSDGSLVVDREKLPKEPNPYDNVGLVISGDKSGEIAKSVKEALARGEVVVMRKPQD